MGSPGEIFHGVTKLDKTSFSLTAGLRSAIFVSLPLIVGFVLGFPETAFVGLGAIFLTNTEGPHSTVPSSMLLVACFTEAAAWGLGTLVGLTGFLAPALIGLGIFFTGLARDNPNRSQVATFTAISFSVGAGLPGGSLSDALQRSYLALFGALFALAGVELYRLIVSRKKSPAKTNLTPTKSTAYPSMLRSEVILNSAVLGIACAIGFGIALALGLPRDFWVVVTIILTFRPTLSLTVTFTTMMVIGTIVGAAIGAVVVLETTNLYLLLALLFVFSVLIFSTRAVNMGLIQVFFAPFIIILLNIIFPAGLLYAEARIFDVVIGGIISVATVYAVSFISRHAS